MSHDHSHDHAPKWKHDGVRVIPGNSLDPNTAQTAGLGPTFKYDKKTAAALKAHAFDAPKMAATGFEYERLDQLTTEVLLGVR